MLGVADSNTTGLRWALKAEGLRNQRSLELIELKEAAALRLEQLFLGCSADAVWSELPMITGMPYNGTTSFF